MALTTAIFVGEAKEWIPELVDWEKKLIVNAGETIRMLVYHMHSNFQGMLNSQIRIICIMNINP